MKALLELVLLLFIFVCAKADANMPEMTEQNGYVEPFQMFDDVYYVGDKWVSSYAVETGTGLVLIDTLDFPYAKWIPHNLKKLGLDNKPITHILVTHGHSDHVGGANYLQQKYGSKLAMTLQGHQLAIKQAQKSKGANQFLPPRLDITVNDGMSLNVGAKVFKLYHTAGHTQGDFSVDFTVQDKGTAHRAFVVGGHSWNSKKPELANVFLASIKRIKELALTPPVVTVNLANHPHKNDLFANRDRKKRGARTNPFISESNFLMFLKQQQNLAKQKLAQ